MRSYRLGNDIGIRWRIFKGSGINEAPFDLTGGNITLSIIDKHKRSVILPHSVDGNIVQAVFYGKDQKYTGPYKVVLELNKGEEGMSTLDKCDAFELVDCSCQATGGSSSGRISFEILELRGSFGTYDGIVDSELSDTSANPVENKAIAKELEKKVDNENGKGLSSNDFSDELKRKLEGIDGTITKEKVESVLTGEITSHNHASQLAKLLEDYVRKVEGKDLSSNDFTDALKRKLDGLSNYDDTQVVKAISDISAALNKLAETSKTHVTADEMNTAILKAITQTLNTEV